MHLIVNCEFLGTKLSGNDEVSGLDSLKAVRLQNPKNIIFSYININSICDKVDSLCSLISSHVDILSIAKTKLDYSFPNAQLLIPYFHQPFHLDIKRNSGGLLAFVRSSVPARMLSNNTITLLLHEQVRLIRLHFQRYFYHHRAT